MIKTFDKYFIKLFFKKILLLTVIFFSLTFILTLFEEITFFGESNSEAHLPFLITFFNVPSTLLEIFPFIVLISTQLFFVEIIKRKENELIKINSLDNFYLIKLLTICSFIFGLIIITLYYPISSKLKFFYFDIKNIYSEDGKYLKHYSGNGLWIKDEIDDEIYIINASYNNKDKFLKNIFINKFDKNFNLIESISSQRVDITSNQWLIEKPTIFKENKQIQLNENIILSSHFNFDKINKSFRDLNSLNLFELFDLKRENELLGYSSQDVDLHFLQIITLPIYLGIMVIISAIIMLNIKRDKPYIFHVLLGILLSVIIYYINNIFNVFGLTNKIPIYLSVFFPIIFLSIISTIGLIRVNEK
ncbi:LptF/LptG family permease [Candidatus Pelagibacter sp.]|uniref:LptF/LptG family permease n=1 Tax=Candidatus Pelagibacter sp. TaxID=2024849 RepID=UPI003F837D9E